MIDNQRILKLVNNYFKIDIASKNRSNKYAFARNIYYGLCRKFNNSSYADIAKHVNRDHATALHGFKVLDQVLTWYPEYKHHYEQLEYLCNNRRFRTTESKYKNSLKLALYYRKKYLESIK